MPDGTCAFCGEPLQGRQRRVCSERCRDRLRRPPTGVRPDWQYDRARAERYDEQGNRRCSKCTKAKSDAEFGRTSLRRDGLHTECRDCRAARHSIRRYGVDYVALLAEQDGKCAMCSALAVDSPYRFAIDHDHACCPQAEYTCGKCVRGIVCRRCNVALGLIEDEVLVARARSYLDRTRERR